MCTTAALLFADTTARNSTMEHIVSDSDHDNDLVLDDVLNTPGVPKLDTTRGGLEQLSGNYRLVVGLPIHCDSLTLISGP